MRIKSKPLTLGIGKSPDLELLCFDLSFSLKAKYIGFVFFILRYYPFDKEQKVYKERYLAYFDFHGFEDFKTLKMSIISFTKIISFKSK